LLTIYQVGEIVIPDRSHHGQDKNQKPKRKMRTLLYSTITGGRTASRSRRAQIAELDGRMPATRAAKAWGFKSAATLKKWVRSREWHHVGKFATITDYYNVSEFIEEADICDITDLVGLASDLTAKGREQVLAPLVANFVSLNLRPSGPRWRSTTGNLTKHLIRCGCEVDSNTAFRVITAIKKGSTLQAEIQKLQKKS
jgi:hypothetical protein